MARKYWLMKSEPETFSFNHLKICKDSTEHWYGVRNYQARNFMRDEMKIGDLILFYHSNCKEPGVVGIAEVVKESYPDFTSWDPKSKYFDPKSTKDNPRWFMVDVQWKEEMKEEVSLESIRNIPELKDMKVIQKGQRLSVQPVTEKEFKIIYEMGMKKKVSIIIRDEITSHPFKK